MMCNIRKVQYLTIKDRDRNIHKHKRTYKRSKFHPSCSTFLLQVSRESRLIVLKFLDPVQTSSSLLPVVTARVVDGRRDHVHHPAVVAVRVAVRGLRAAVLLVRRVVLLAQRLNALPPKFLLGLKIPQFMALDAM